MVTIADRSTHLGQGITAGQVEDLRTEAAQAGDSHMVAICEDALEHDRAAIAICASVIRNAKAMHDDSTR